MRKNYFWNTLGSLMNAASTVLMLMAVTRTMGAAAGGIFSLAYAIAQQLMVIGHFEIRTYQATDTEEKRTSCNIKSSVLLKHTMKHIFNNVKETQ